MLAFLKKHFSADANYLIFQNNEGAMDRFCKARLDNNGGEKLAGLGRQIGWVPDHFPPLFFCRSTEMEIAESIAFSQDRIRISGDDLKITQQLLKETGLIHLGDKSPHYLSEGERKLIWLLCQYAKSPRYLIIGSLLKNLSAHSFRTIFHFLVARQSVNDRRTKLIIGYTRKEEKWFESLKQHSDWKWITDWPDES